VGTPILLWAQLSLCLVLGRSAYSLVLAVTVPGLAAGETGDRAPVEALFGVIEWETVQNQRRTIRRPQLVNRTMGE
jgi:hypothetical protein